MKRKQKRIISFFLAVTMLAVNVLSVAASPEKKENETDGGEQYPYTLTVEVEGEGTAEITGEGIREKDAYYEVPAGNEVSVTVNPADGYHPGTVMLENELLEGLSFIMPDRNAILKVTFTEKEGEEQIQPDGDVITPGGEYVAGNTVAVQTRDVLLGDTQKTVYNPGGADLTDVLGVERENLLEWLGQHVNDDYYLGTPYQPNDWRSPNGDISYNGSPGMNCTGFVWHALRKAGANENTPGVSGWVRMISDNHMEYVTYTGSNWNDVSASVGWDGICEPGDLIWTWDLTKGDLQDGLSWNPSPHHHISIFIGSYFDDVKIPGSPYWQDGLVEDRIWHSSDDNAAGVQAVGNVSTWMVPKEWTGPYAVTVLKMKNRDGEIELKKSSANPELTNNNTCYSLKGAVYGVYDAGGAEIATLTTDETGYAKAEGIKKGTYTVKEKIPPKGYALDSKKYTVTVPAGQMATLKVTDYPQSDPVPILLGKIDADTNQNKPQGSALLENAEFTVKYYGVLSDIDPAEKGMSPVRTWVLKTRADGKTLLSDTFKVSGDEFYYTSIGIPTLPIGTITIQETKAPKGYLLNSEIFIRQITPAGNVEAVETYNMPTVPETPQKGIIRLEKKSSEADYGTATLKGAEYGVFKDKSCMDKVDTMVTDVKGAAQSKELPWGTYYVKETKNPVGFLTDPNVYPVDLTTDNKTDRVFYKTVTSTEVPQKGIIELEKLDSESGKNVPQGAGSLKDAKYDIFLKSAYQTGDNTTSKSYKGSLTTDKNGKAKSGELPLETYYVIERQPGTGYLVDPGIYEVTLSSDNRTDRIFYKTVKSKEDIIRGNVEIIKLKEIGNEDEDTFEGLEGVEFTFTSDTTGKVVKKIVTDKYGFATTVDKDHPRGGLIFDTYTVTETKCPEGLKPIEPFRVTIKEEGVTLKGIYKEDKLIVSPVSVVKVDGSTGKVIPAANTEFRLLDENKKPVTMITHYPDKVEHKSFKTDENGQFTFPDKLKYGTYYLEELNAPSGYLKGELLEFRVTEGATWEKPLVVKYADENAMGQIRITKTSSGKNEKLKGAVFEIRAAEDIMTPDGTVRMNKGDLAETVTTGEDGTVTSKKLYLGNYDVKETQQPQGFVLNKKTYHVELKYRDQVTAVVTEEISVTNKPTEIEILKVDRDTKKPLEGVAFKIWNKAMLPENGTDKETGDDLQDNMGVFTEDDRVDPDAAVISGYKTDADGKISLQYLAPGTYRIQESGTIPGYVLNDKVYEITIAEDGRADGEEIGRVTVENEITKIDLGKHDLFSGKEIEGGRYQVLDKDGNVIDEWKGTKEPHRIQGLTVGKTYVFKEVLAPEGYLLAQDVEFTIEPTGEVQKVKMYDELAMGRITIRKTDSETGDKVSGAYFKVTAAEDIVSPDGTLRMKKGDIADHICTKDGEAQTQRLFLGKYDVVESRAAQGYVLNEKVYHVELKYKDQVTAVVTEELSVTNKPTEIEILKVDRDTKRPLSGVTFKIWNKDMESGTDAEMGVIQEAVTDKDGKIILKRLIPGTYRIQESETIPGYVLNEKVYEITIAEDGSADGEETGRITVENVITKLLGTVAKNQDTGTQEAVPKKNVTIVDTVKFADLQIGQEYTLKGILMDKSTGKPLLVDGKEVTAEKKFKAEKADGTVDVIFTFDASALKGKQVVVFEKVYIDEKEILAHEDINDKGQTITFKVGKLTPELPGNGNGGLFTALKTGDTAALLPWIILTVAAAGCIAAFAVRYVKRKKGSGEAGHEE